MALTRKRASDFVDVLGRKQDDAPLSSALDRKAKSTQPRVWEFTREALSLLRPVLEKHGWPVPVRSVGRAMLAAQRAGDLDLSPVVAKYGADSVTTLGFIILPVLDGDSGARAFRCEMVNGRVVVVPPGGKASGAPSAAVTPKCLFFPFGGPQEDFLASTEDEVLFGGAKGGAKTESFVADASRYIEKPLYKALITRKTLPALAEVIRRAKLTYGTTGTPTDGLGATYNESSRVFAFPDGAIIELGFLETPEDAERYQGREPSRVYLDEAAQIAQPKSIEIVSAEIRSPDKSILPGVRYSANPIGPGVPYLKRRIIEKCGFKGETVFVEHVKLPTGDTVEWKRRFIPSRVTDNPVYARDLKYLARLMKLPEGLRKLLLDGDWSAALGGFYIIDRTRHLIPSYKWGDWIRLRCGFDWGFAHRWALTIGFRDEDGRLIIADTLWGRRQQPDEVAEGWREWELREDAIGEGKPARHRRLRQIYASPILFAQRPEARVGAKTRAEEFAMERFALMEGDESGGSRRRKGETLRGMLTRDEIAFMDTPGNRILVGQLEMIVPDPDNVEEPLKVDFDPDADTESEILGGQSVEMNFSGDDGQDGLWFLVDVERSGPSRMPKKPTKASRNHDTHYETLMAARERAHRPGARGF